MQRRYGPQLARRTDRLPTNHRPRSWPRGAAGPESPVIGPDVRDPRLARLEAVLFAAEEPLAARRLAAVAELTDASEARRLVDRLRALLVMENSAFRVEVIAGGVQLLTGPEYHPWLVRLRQTAGEPKLSGSAPGDAGDHRISPTNHASRSGGRARGPLRRCVAGAHGARVDPHRRPSRLPGPAGFVRHNQEIPGDVRPARFAGLAAGRLAMLRRRASAVSWFTRRPPGSATCRSLQSPPRHRPPPSGTRAASGPPPPPAASP